MYAGIDIGGTSIKVGIVDESGEIVAEYGHPTNAESGPEAMLGDIYDILATTLNNHNPKSVGVGFPSVVHPQTGTVHHPPNLKGWGVVPIRSLLQERSPVPVAVDNDANVAALAEARIGAGVAHKDFLYVTLGTGVGGGIISGGKLFAGERGGAGEIGHIHIRAGESPLATSTQRLGALESFVGRQGILSCARALATAYPSSLLAQVSEIDVHDISHCAEQGDVAALTCLDYCGQILGLGLSSILAVLDMRVIIVGGGISQAHPALLQATLRTLQAKSLPTIRNEVTLLPAKFIHKAGIVGAAMLGKDALLT